MDELIKSVLMLEGYRMGSTDIKAICYTDNVVLVARNEDSV